MAIALPQLDVYCIDFHERTEKEEKIIRAYTKKVKKRIILHDPLKDRQFPIELQTEEIEIEVDPMKLAIEVAKFTLGKAVKDVVRFIQNNRFHIITTEEELSDYINANNNEWHITKKILNKPQYYIRHPKKGKQNVLIEANCFYDYIYEEYSRELINYCTSHCKSKIIQINKYDSKTANIKAKYGKAKGKVEFSKRRGNVFEMINPNGSKQSEPFEQYYWLEPKLMESINALNKGGHIGIKDERDFTFGISASEARSLGLDLKLHKEFVFSIYIEC